MKKIMVFYLYYRGSTYTELTSGQKIFQYEGLLDEERVGKLKLEVSKFLRNGRETASQIHITGMLPL